MVAKPPIEQKICSKNHPLLPLISRLQTAYPKLQFRFGKRFIYRPPHTIFVGSPEPHAELLLLHELGHALLGHQTFKSDLERLKIERAAWDKARELAIKHHIPFNENFAETELDTYRDWLHTKAKCKKCGLSRYQTPDGIYHCPHCEPN